MDLNKPILHARDHLPGGADPIPGLCTSCAKATPVDGSIPSTGAGDPAGNDWHWWRFREPGQYQLSPLAARYSPDQGPSPGASHGTDMEMRSTGHTATIEAVGGKPGPNANSTAAYREQDTATGHDPHNWFQALTSITHSEFGVGAEQSLVGWFNLNALPGVNDLWHIYPPTASGDPTYETYLQANSDGSLTLVRDGTAFTTAAGLISAGSWFYWAFVVGSGRIRLYVNPGAPVATTPSPTSGTSFPFTGPLAMETQGPTLDYTAAELAARLNASGFKSVALQLNGDYGGL